MADYISQFTGSEIDARLAKVSQLESGKQDNLVSGTNIKTINGQSVLGGGNLQIQAGDTDAVKYVSQDLTDAQKAQARANIDAASLEDIQDMDFVTATTLPTASASTMGHIYLIGPDTNNNYDRYFTQESSGSYSWVSLGSTEIDLSTYATQEELNQLEAKVDDFATGKYYGTFTSSTLLPEGTISGFAYIGSGNPFEVWVFNGTSWADSGATMDGTDIPSLNPFKGMYNSIALLETAYPNPQLGDYAYVKNSGTPATANIYNVVGGEWTDTGVPVGITDYDSIFTMSAKLMLIQTLGKVAWIDTHGQDYLNELKESLIGTIGLESITAVFTPGNAVITDTTPLEDLMQYLTVTAIFSDLSQETVYNYSITGTLVAGINTITVTYLDQTTTFQATAVHNYAGILSTWTLHPATSVAEYTNGYIRLKCNNAGDQSGYGVWAADAGKTLWSAVDGKTVKVRIKVNDKSSSVMSTGIGVYVNSSISSMSNANARRMGLSFVLADDGYYECQCTLNIADFTIGSLTPKENSTFGVFCYSRSLNTYAEIYDAQIIEVTS